MIKILVPVDGSAASMRALDHAIAFAKERGKAELVLLNVQPPLVVPLPAPVLSSGEEEAWYRAAGEEALKAPQQRCRDAGLVCRALMQVGSIAPTISDIAGAEKCDLVVMGTRGLGSVPSLVVGSVAISVIHQASVAVTLVK